MSDFIKVDQGDSSKQFVDIKKIKPINNIKVIRPEESDYSELSSDDMSSVSVEPEPKIKKMKKVLRKKERSYEEPRNYSAFSNPKKVSQREEEYSDSEYSSTDQSYGGDSYDSYSENGAQDNKASFEEKQKLKQDILIKIQALEKKGFEFSKKFNMTSSYEEMEFEYMKVKRYLESQAGIKFARRCLMACVTGIEFLNKRFDPFNIKLEGWSENVMESVEDYDNVFEKLHEKYSSKTEVAPEIELLLMLGGSAFMFHLTNSLLKGPMMNNPILAQNNPNFMASMMGAMSQGMKEMNKPPNFQQQQPPQQTEFPQPMETRGVRKEMRGPTMDPNLFNGTPLATNYPKPPVFNNDYKTYEENPIMDDDRVSVVSTDTSVSSISLGSTVKTLNIKKSTNKKGGGGFELNIR